MYSSTTLGIILTYHTILQDASYLSISGTGREYHKQWYLKYLSYYSKADFRFISMTGRKIPTESINLKFCFTNHDGYWLHFMVD